MLPSSKEFAGKTKPIKKDKLYLLNTCLIPFPRIYIAFLKWLESLKKRAEDTVSEW
jgi:hypothetical protein